MGTLVGHVAPGFGFFALGLWHLLNHIKLHALNPKYYTSMPWFPTSRKRYLELYLIMVGCSMSISMELFIGPARHQPLGPDGTIPSNHLHNFEHSTISLSIFVYALSAIILDKFAPNKSQHGLTLLVGASAFSQQLLLFHLHSADHMGVEGQYHLLLQVVIAISLLTTLMGIGYPKSFLISFVRSISILFQGVWLMVMGFMLWTPQFMPKGCFMHLEEGHTVVRCGSHQALKRAKALVNVEFSWLLVLVMIFSMCLYMFFTKVYGGRVEYKSLSKYEEPEEVEDAEAQKKNKHFVDHMEKAFIPMDIER
ncbi:Transmembrane protein like [Actinidia chinensis var. chinensis]|uniref:Transmembrane protein like n=1 Tax=Actinidia chinensis var. chinensis TaxID=1590841 RepID=A0A2R6PGF4_ACTCC|nr:Transmembrane protein like [Actinidia chinensis var. chinensis]